MTVTIDTFEVPKQVTNQDLIFFRVITPSTYPNLQYRKYNDAIEGGEAWLRWSKVTGIQIAEVTKETPDSDEVEKIIL